MEENLKMKTRYLTLLTAVCLVSPGMIQSTYGLTEGQKTKVVEAFTTKRNAADLKAESDLKRMIGTLSASSSDATKFIGNSNLKFGLYGKGKVADEPKLIATIEVNLYTSMFKRNLYKMYDDKGTLVSEGRAFIKFADPAKTKMDIALIPGTISSFLPGAKGPILGFQADADYLRYNGKKGVENDCVIIMPELVLNTDIVPKAKAAMGKSIPITKGKALVFE